MRNMLRRLYSVAVLLLLIQSVNAQNVLGQAVADASAELRVQIGKSLVVRSEETLQRVSVTNPAIATAVIISPNQVLINGLAAGTVSLILWDEQDQTRSFNLTVDLDVAPLSQALSDTFPGEGIRVGQSGAAVVLSGSVSSKDVADKAAALAATRGAVVNLLVPTEGHQIVMLQVRFAEVDRVAVSQLGMNLLSLGAANTIGATSTQQFGPPQLQNQGISKNAGGFALSDLLNVFLFRPDIDLAVTIKALQQKNVLQILAEPNVMALNGREASFLAGGEFPFPVVQGGTNTTAVTIQFREFGVRLNFTPTVLSDNTIRLKVAPEVSSLDFSNALTISGFLVPALSSRKATTEVELRDGQSFAIAGLIDNRLSEIANKIPILGDIPILGNFFKSRATNKNSTELLVMVTPHVVSAVNPSNLPQGPEFPKPFLDREKFDGPAGETPAQRSALPQAPVAAADNRQPQQ